MALLQSASRFHRTKNVKNIKAEWVVQALSPSYCNVLATGVRYSSNDASLPKKMNKGGDGSNNDEISRRRQQQEMLRKELLVEASCLTKSLYRTCLRSVKLIRYGNEQDEENFKQFEEKRLNQSLGGDSTCHGASSTISISMLPPVDREDELRSRAEYYSMYARENFVQEADCLPRDRPLMKEDINRYLHFLRKGDRDRKWLLKDMKFTDPFHGAIDEEKIQQFEERALAYIHVNEHPKKNKPARIDTLEDEDDDESDYDDDDEWEVSDSDDEEDDEEHVELPPWLKTHTKTGQRKS